MGRVLMVGPPPGDYCLACLMQAKQRQWEAFQKEIQAGYDAPGDKVTVIAWLDGLTKELREPEYRAVCGDFPGTGVVDGLCWDHVAGINPSKPAPSGLAVANGGLPEGFRRPR